MCQVLIGILQAMLTYLLKITLPSLISATRERTQQLEGLAEKRGTCSRVITTVVDVGHLSVYIC